MIFDTRRFGLIRPIVAVGAALFAAGMVASCDQPSFGTRLTAGQAREIGAEAAVQIESQYKPGGHSEPGVADYLSISANLAKHVTRLPPQATLQFNAIETGDEEAISLPDGHIFLSTGLLQRIAADPNQIAGVVAHEIGHVEFSHDAENLVSALGSDDIADMLAEGKYEDVVRTELQLVRLSYTNEQEYQADQYAVRLAGASGYDASALVTFLAATAAEPDSEDQVSWDVSHPISRSRISKVKQDIAALGR
jgi:predicted Zn-dependent protease